MTEQQLREKLQFAYGNMPDATRAAFEHSLTHHRAPETHRNIGLNRTMWRSTSVSRRSSASSR